jgi:hypothetical protein
VFIGDEVPAGKIGAVGVTTIDCSAPVTSRFAEVVCDPRVAVMVQAPTAIPFARPRAPLRLLIVATEGFGHSQNTDDVTSCVLPSA